MTLTILSTNFIPKKQSIQIENKQLRLHRLILP